MGRQLSFYLMPDDEKQFLIDVLKNSDIKLISSRTANPIPEIIKPSEINNKKELKYYFWDSKYPIEDDFSIVFEKQLNQKTGDLIPTGKTYYQITNINSKALVEYLRSRISSKNILTRGRIWAEMYRLSNDKTSLEFKGESYSNWFTEIEKWFKKNCILEKTNGICFYIGKNAVDWKNNGGLIG
jgi:hypothetical protein